MSKKLIALLMAAMMLLSVAAACGNDKPAETPTEPDATTPNTPAATTPAATEPAKTEKVYGDYLSKDVALMNAHDEPDSTIQTCYNFIGATLYRDVPDEDGLGYHYVGDLAADMPVLVSTQEEAPYTKYTAEEQTDGTTKMVATEATGTLTTWQIKIRDDATWHNGEKLDAEDIMYSWKMLLDPVMLNQCANFMYEQSITVFNAEKYYRGECEWEDVGIKMLDGIRAQSFHHLQVPPTQNLLTINAWSAIGDGVVEGVEYGDHLLGIQSHPEADALLPEIFTFLTEEDHRA